MKDEAEMSAASRGSQKPAAWAAFADDSGETGATSLNRQAVEEVAARMGWQVAALYRSLTLTGKELEAIEAARDILREMGDDNGEPFAAEVEAISGLLERLN